MDFAVASLPWLGGLLALGCLLASFRNFRRRSLTEALPTSRALGVFIGLVEMKGNAECEQPLRSPLAEASCVHYEWSVEEQWRKEETRTVTDSSGNSKTETSTSSGWEKVGGSSASVPFYVRDATGSILVQPKGAEMGAKVVLDRTCSTDDALYYGKGPHNDIADSVHRRRFVEKTIRLHGPVYVVGKARERKDVVAAEIAADEYAPMFLISAYTEKEVKTGFLLHGVAWSVMGLVLLVGGLMLKDGLMGVALRPRSDLYLSCAGAFVGAWALAWVWNVFNDLIGLRNRVREGWALIDIQLKRRFDLIPNLVRIVAAIRDHEGKIQEHLALLRAQAAATPPGKPGPDHQALKPVLAAVQENYPVLSAMPAFRKLQESLVDTEERIALARDYYNNIATHFNTRVEQQPYGLVSMLAAMRRFDLYAVRDFERAAVKVDFAK